MMYVVGSLDENEIMLYNVILALRDSLHLLFKYVPSLSFLLCRKFPQAGIGSAASIPSLPSIQDRTILTMRIDNL
jgi:hypothetical protein